LNRQRKQRTKPEYQLELVFSKDDKEYLLQLPAPRNNPDPDTQLLFKEILELLDDREKRIFEMNRLGVEDEKIAQEIGINVENLRVVRYRALVRLRKDLAQGIRKMRWTVRLSLEQTVNQ
jgi:DNA-directed RNA polymerase specialized sigma24 family protein